jgi:hypothetical protein
MWKRTSSQADIHLRLQDLWRFIAFLQRLSRFVLRQRLRRVKSAGRVPEKSAKLKKPAGWLLFD